MPTKKKPAPKAETQEDIESAIRDMGMESATTAPDIDPWLVNPWVPETIKVWSTGPDKEKFKSYAESQGLGDVISEQEPISTTQLNAPGGMDMTDWAQLKAEITAQIMASMSLGSAATAAPTASSDSTDLVEFPPEYEITLDNGDVLRQPLYPINIAGEDHMDTGYYRKETAARLREEIEGAEFVEIPQNAAFIQHTFRRKNSLGNFESVTETFFYPGQFCGKSLAASLKAQTDNLVEFVMPGGKIAGTSVRYDALETNGISLVPGFVYQMPPRVKEDHDRRLAQHVESFHRLTQQRGVMQAAEDQVVTSSQLAGRISARRQAENREPVPGVVRR